MSAADVLGMLNWPHYEAIVRSLLGENALLFGVDRGSAEFAYTTLNKPAANELQASQLIALFDDEALSGGKTIALSASESVYAQSLQNAEGDEICIFAIQFMGVSELPVQYTKTIDSICTLISNEIDLNSELDSIAEELSDRYEELNLIYGTDDVSEQMDRGGHALSTLLTQCAQRTSVQSSVLYLVDQKYFACEQTDDATLAEEELRVLAQESILPWLQEKPETLVLNEVDTPEVTSRIGTLGHKAILCPISGYGDRLAGFIAAFNDESQSDFTNSDRNLLQILGRKASGVIRSNYDELTGLASRASFDHALKETIENTASNETGSLLIVNPRGLQMINDAAGNAGGDALLRMLGQHLATTLGEGFFIARLDGDKFAVIARSHTVESSETIAQSLLESINDLGFEYSGEKFHISACMGLVPINSGDSQEGVLGTANIALQLACDKGNNLIEVQRDDNDEIEQRKLRMRALNKIHEALEHDRFELFWQGVYAMEDTKEPHHYEVLIRMQDADGSLIPPDLFIPAAEYYKVMPDVDRWVIHSTLEFLSRNWANLRDSKQSWAINLSGQTFTQPGLLEFISKELSRSGVPAERIAFEVTETVAVENLADAREIIKSVQNLGCEFYLDDFGTGLSSFTYLQELPFDHVKIDGRFIKDVVDDNVAQAMVKAIADVAAVLGMKTVAEYVENDETIAVLEGLGVDYLQGWGLDRPTSMYEIVDKLVPSNQQASK